MPTVVEQLRRSAAVTQLKINLFEVRDVSTAAVQQQTGDAFSNKWRSLEQGSTDYDRVESFQKQRFLLLYGFEDVEDLRLFLAGCSRIIDCGCGLGYKSAWFAELAPHAEVVGVDYSDSVYSAAKFFEGRYSNLTFLRADIGGMPYFNDESFDFVCCDQVVMHTEKPRSTFAELVRLAARRGEIACYVYRKKALPRELLDDYFRDYAETFSHESLVELSGQLTELGRLLSDKFPDEIEFPAIPALGIEGGTHTVQRFLYWNFVKCFWNEDLGTKASMLTNYDWYAPAQAERYSREEFLNWVRDESLSISAFYSDPACFSGRFKR